MKEKILFTLLLVFISLNIVAQNTTEECTNPFSRNPRRNFDMEVVDSGTVRVLYALNALDIDKPETYDDLQRLDIGTRFSKYYSFFVFNSDSLVSEWRKKNPKAESFPRRLGPRGKIDSWSEYFYGEYFKDFSKNMLTEYAGLPLYLGNYNTQSEEKIPLQDWEIEDDTLTVIGYLCQKATCKFRGREYIAWFTIDIPINNGPWKFGGLPGLILKVCDKDKFYNFECIGIENHKKKYPIKIFKLSKQFKKEDRMKLWKRKKDTQENYYQIMGIVGTNLRPLCPYNPLELE
ncbi:MAG: GLPGLI family protein [Dysgonamonadaceae bacterium]|nr:GLPGLI family protein [Dysgonamonadaceae bacterium]